MRVCTNKVWTEWEDGKINGLMNRLEFEGMGGGLIGRVDGWIADGKWWWVKLIIWVIWPFVYKIFYLLIGGMHVYTCVYAGVWTYVHMFRGQGRILGVIICCSLPYSLYIKAEPRGYYFWLGWWPARSMDFSCLYTSVLGLQAYAVMPGCFHWCWDLNAGLHGVQQVLLSSERLPSLH